MKLYSSIRSKTLLEEPLQIIICSSYNHKIDVISVCAANTLQVYKNKDEENA